jgi:hypothetical protein
MINKMIKNFEKNSMELIYVKNRAEAFELAKGYIKPGISIGLGGSTTVKEIGLLDFILKSDEITVYNQYEAGISIEENEKRRREGLLSDLYITGTNALSINGELINADGSGNRVAAQIFGPKKVLIFAGKNKIVQNIEEGFKRIREVAIPKNIERINAMAIANGKKPTYDENNIANKFSYINGDKKGRTTIILIDESLGF